MSLHDKIMNIQTSPEIEEVNEQQRIDYKTGHRDARHAAAELSLQYERALNKAMFFITNLARKADDPNVARASGITKKEIEDILKEC